MKEIFDKLIFSLGRVEVRGKENMYILLGCIQTLEQLRDMIKVETREIHPEEEKTDATYDKQGDNG